MSLYLISVVAGLLVFAVLIGMRRSYLLRMDEAAGLVTQARENMMFGNELATVSAFQQLTEAREILTGWKERR